MSLYVYCPRPSNGALELVRALGAQRLRRFDGMDFWDKRRRFKLSPGDSLVCWGTCIPEIDGVKVLNSAQNHIDKMAELQKLAQAGIPTITLYAKADKDYGKILLPRKAHHSGGKDLLLTPDFPDYFVQKEDFSEEYRVHSFNGKSIRAGIKVHRDGFTLVGKEADWKPDSNLIHPWVRSFDGGWRVKYDDFQSNPKLRKIAALAVKAMGLTFGAVDIAQRRVDGIYKVLEVNRAPGIEGNSIGAYVRSINKWIGGEPEGE